MTTDTKLAADAPPDRVRQYVNSSDPGTRLLAARHPDCPPYLLMSLTGDPSFEVLKSLSRREELPVQVQGGLVAHPNFAVRREFALNRHRDPSTDDALLADDDGVVRTHAAWNVSAGKAAELVGHPDPFMRSDALMGWNATKEMRDAGLADHDPHVRAAAFSLPQFPLTAEQVAAGCSDVDRRVRMGWAQRAESLPQERSDALLADWDPVVRFEAAKHAVPSPDADLELVNDTDADVRLARALNPHDPPPGAAAVQARDPQPAVRLTSAARRTLPAHAAAGLALDAHPEVRALARDTHKLPRSVRRQSLKLDKADTRNGAHHDPVTPRHNAARHSLHHPDDPPAAGTEVRAAMAHNYSPHTPPSVLLSIRSTPAERPAGEPADAAAMLRSLGYTPTRGRRLPSGAPTHRRPPPDGGLEAVRIGQHRRRSTVQAAGPVMPAPTARQGPSLTLHSTRRDRPAPGRRPTPGNSPRTGQTMLGCGQSSPPSATARR